MLHHRALPPRFFACWFGGLLFAPAYAGAEERPAGLIANDGAAPITTEVAQEGFQTATIPEEESTDAMELAVSAGGLAAIGNSRALSVTAAQSFKLRRGPNQLTDAAALNFGRAAAQRDVPMETIIENYQLRVRYDYFLTKTIAAFLSTSARRDRFQGLDLRLNIDPGIAYYFIDQPRQQLRGEAGYDLQYDVRRAEALDDAEAAGTPMNKTEARHHARVFVGFDTKPNPAVVFSTGLEYLQGLAPFEDEATGRTNWRLNWEASLTSSIADRFSVATTVNIRYDNNPLPSLERTDAITSVNLVYSLL